MVDKIIVINLDRRPDRYCGWLGAMNDVDMPPECLERFSAVDGLTHGLTWMIDAALQIVPGWADVDRYDSVIWKECKRGTMATALSGLWVLKSIADADNVFTVFIYDHYYLCRPWSELRSFVESLVPFDILQLRHWDFSLNPYALPGYPKKVVGNKSVSHGFGYGGDFCLVLSSEGARRLLDWWDAKPFYALEDVIRDVALLPLAEQEGVLSVIRVLDWVHGAIALSRYGVGIDSDWVSIDSKKTRG